MTGRGVDQILPSRSKPRLYESYVTNAEDYVVLAEQANGVIRRPVSFGYPWGDALDELRRRAPDVRIVNLETSVTTSDEPWPDKGINYRMHPANVPCLGAAAIDVCALANNHVLDWGRAGLVETLEVLRRAGIATPGAGRSAAEANAITTVALSSGARVLVVALGDVSSGVPPEWEATSDRPGVAMIHDLSSEEARAIAERLARAKRPGDVCVVSIHWGSNWGYGVPDEHVAFAHALVEGGVDLVHGHSSHHPRPIELHRGKPILYGCGDLLNDYEGISGYESYRGELALMYFPRFEGERVGLSMVPMRVRRMRLERASATDARWLATTLSRVSRPYGTIIEEADDGTLVARG